MTSQLVVCQEFPQLHGAGIWTYCLIKYSVTFKTMAIAFANIHQMYQCSDLPLLKSPLPLYLGQAAQIHLPQAKHQAQPPPHHKQRVLDNAELPFPI